MTIRFLLFQGTWENEGNFWALETNQDILILAAGISAPFIRQKNSDWSYLKKNKKKIKAILINNAAPKNSSYLMDFYKELELKVPIYGSNYTKLIFDYLWPSTSLIKENFRLIELNKDIKVGETRLRFLPLNSYILGNLAISISYENHTIYYLDDFILNNNSPNNLLSEAGFLRRLKDLTSQQKKNVYLVAGCQNMRWSNNNSLFLATQSFAQQDENYFFLLYDHDWLHILECLELVRKWKSKVRVLDHDFLLLLKEVLKDNSLASLILSPEEKDPERVIYLLVGSPFNIQEKLIKSLTGKNFAKKDSFIFIVGISSVQGGEEKIARIVDYLYQQKSKVWNLSRHEAFSLGTSFDDLKLLLEIIQPQLTITIQNSYKQKKYLSYLSEKNFLAFPNQSHLTLPTQKIYPFKEKEKQDTEKLLAIQRHNLLQTGFLLVFIQVSWEKVQNELKKVPRIKNLTLESAAISTVVNLKKIEDKIRQWWEKKTQEMITSSDLGKDDYLKIWKKKLERYLSSSIERYFNFEYDIEIKEPIILLFLEREMNHFDSTS